MILLAIDATHGTLTRYESCNAAPRAVPTHRFDRGEPASFCVEIVNDMRYVPLLKHSLDEDRFYFNDAEVEA